LIFKGFDIITEEEWASIMYKSGLKKKQPKIELRMEKDSKDMEIV
jgi:hypothetical protein